MRGACLNEDKRADSRKQGIQSQKWPFFFILLSLGIKGKATLDVERGRPDMAHTIA
jgi:hypothetical protein